MGNSKTMFFNRMSNSLFLKVRRKYTTEMFRQDNKRQRDRQTVR